MRRKPCSNPEKLQLLAKNALSEQKELICATVASMSFIKVIEEFQKNSTSITLPFAEFKNQPLPTLAVVDRVVSGGFNHLRKFCCILIVKSGVDYYLMLNNLFTQYYII